MLQRLPPFSKLHYKGVCTGVEGESLHTRALEIFSNGVWKTGSDTSKHNWTPAGVDEANFEQLFKDFRF